MIAGLNAVGPSLSRVLALRPDEVGRISLSVVLWPHADAVVVEQPLAGSYLRWTAWDGPWVFAGRHWHQPLSEAAVAYHLTEKTRDPPGGP